LARPRAGSDCSDLSLGTADPTSSRIRVLVCAPSNTAVDEVLDGVKVWWGGGLRVLPFPTSNCDHYPNPFLVLVVAPQIVYRIIKKGILDSDGKRWNDLNVVRVGRAGGRLRAMGGHSKEGFVRADVLSSPGVVAMVDSVSLDFLVDSRRYFPPSICSTVLLVNQWCSGVAHSKIMRLTTSDVYVLRTRGPQEIHDDR